MASVTVVKWAGSETNDVLRRSQCGYLGKDFGRGDMGLAEWTFNEPSRSWIDSCSKGEAEKLELARMEQCCRDRYGAVCMRQTLFVVE